MCILIIELVWVEKYGKMGEKPPFLGFPEVPSVTSNSDSLWPLNSLKVGLCSSQFLVQF